jgi:hypothetical protein
MLMGFWEIPVSMAQLFRGSPWQIISKQGWRFSAISGSFCDHWKLPGVTESEGSEETAENYWAWGKEWTLAMLTSIITANGVTYIFQKWLFWKMCSAALGSKCHLPCIIKYLLRDTAVYDLKAWFSAGFCGCPLDLSLNVPSSNF